MKNKLLAATLALWTLTPAASFAQTTLYGITTANAVFTISDVSMPSAITGPYSISGVASGQVLTAIDFRPSTGKLYALGYDSLAHIGELYMISNSGTTYTASAVSGTLTSMDLGLTNNAAFDFISTADNQIRVVGRNGNNYIMNALDGTIMTTGTSGLSFALGDLHSGVGSLAATAYTNSFYGADVTQEVGYDAVNNVLVTMDAGNFGNLFNNASNTIHSVGVSIGTTLTSLGSIGMDSWYDTLTHNNVIYLSGSPLLSGAHLFKYDLSGMTGAVVDLGAIGSGSLNVRDVAFQTVRDSTSAVTGSLLTGLSLNLRNLVYFDSYHPQNIRKMVALNGMTAGQMMVAIDYGATGMLYGLGYNSILHTFQLYTIDTLTGHVSAINTTAGSLNLGTDDGSADYVNAAFRFIPTATNQIRVIGNNGSTNVVLDATTGTIVSTDAALSYITGDANFGTTASLTSVGFTGFNGDTSTQVFGFDANTGNMVMFNTTDGMTGYGTGASGYINTGVGLSSVLSLLVHNSFYNNAHLNIGYDATTMANAGFMVSNYIGDSSNMLNYSVLYDMSDMLTGYHKGTVVTPTAVGRVGYATPVKDIAIRRSAMSVTTGLASVNNNSDVVLYPNPVGSTTKVLLPVPVIGNAYVDVVDMNGNVTRSFQYAPGSYLLEVDMSRLPTGLYSVRVSGKGIPDYNIKAVKE